MGVQLQLVRGSESKRDRIILRLQSVCNCSYSRIPGVLGTGCRSLFHSFFDISVSV